MKKKLQFCAALLTAALVVSTGMAQGSKYTVDSTMGDLLDNPQAHSILEKYIPAVVSSPQIDQGRALTLRALQQYVPSLTDDMLKQIGDELAKIPS
jgi:para-nitrobenzyl esterase